MDLVFINMWLASLIIVLGIGFSAGAKYERLFGGDESGGPKEP